MVCPWVHVTCYMKKKDKEKKNNDKANKAKEGGKKKKKRESHIRKTKPTDYTVYVPNTCQNPTRCVSAMLVLLDWGHCSTGQKKKNTAAKRISCTRDWK